MRTTRPPLFLALVLGLVGAGLPARNAGAQDVPRYLLFAGADLWREGGAGHGGLIWSPNGLANEGFALKLMLGGGTYRYTVGPTPVDARQFVGAVMPGWRFKSGGLELTAYAGLDAQDHRLQPDDPTNRLRGTHLGLRAGFDAWFEPTAALMMTASASVSTVGSGYWSRVAMGFRLAHVWIGPELTALGDTAYHQWRIGAHLTALKFGDTEWSGGAGYVQDSDARAGAYARLSVLARR